LKFQQVVKSVVKVTMKVLITGGAGLIGLKLTNEFVAQGRQVKWLDILDPQIHYQQPNFAELAGGSLELVIEDVSDRSLWLKSTKNIDTIYHFAAQTGTGQSTYRLELVRLDGSGYTKFLVEPSREELI
jgi:dTDP-L-rhamnose 4-epimerase